MIDENVDEFYQALRDKRYPVHQEFYERHKQRQRDVGLFIEISNASVNIRKKLWRYLDAQISNLQEIFEIGQNTQKFVLFLFNKR